MFSVRRITEINKELGSNATALGYSNYPLYTWKDIPRWEDDVSEMTCQSARTVQNSRNTESTFVNDFHLRDALRDAFKQ